jgi:hypothetical protein
MMEGLGIQQWKKEPRRKTADTSRREREFNKAVRQTLELEVVKRAVGFSSGLRKVTGHCGGVGPFRNERRDCTQIKSQRCRSTGHSR